jgi:hypothetical protein
LLLRRLFRTGDPLCQRSAAVGRVNDTGNVQARESDAQGLEHLLDIPCSPIDDMAQATRGEAECFGHLFV